MLTSGVTTRSYTTTAATPITPGANYRFMVQSRNVVGLSQNSTQFNILAAIVPVAPSVPVTSNDGTNVYIDWNPPSLSPVANYGDTIRGYVIEFLHSDQITFSSVLQYCDGQNDQNVIQSSSCVVPQSVFQSAPFSLQLGSPVLVKVTAYNSVGYGQSSQIGGTAVSAIVPLPPKALANNPALTSISQISFTWQDGDFNGGAPVLDYQIEYDLGSVGASW